MLMHMVIPCRRLDADVAGVDMGRETDWSLLRTVSQSTCDLLQSSGPVHDIQKKDPVVFCTCDRKEIRNYRTIVFKAFLFTFHPRLSKQLEAKKESNYRLYHQHWISRSGHHKEAMRSPDCLGSMLA